MLDSCIAKAVAKLLRNLLFLFAMLPVLAGAAADELAANATAADPSLHQDPHVWTFIAMPLVVHWESSPDHKYSFAFAIERRNESTDFLQGFALFRNSFGQPSAYAYLGQRWSNVWGNPNITFKLTGGILYGYVDKWKDRVPFNNNGFSPAVVPALVYHLDRDQSFDVMVLGVGGLGFSYSKRF